MLSKCAIFHIFPACQNLECNDQICKEGFYDYPYCKPCECSDEGSTSKICDTLTGQCYCKPNIDHRQCDSCMIGYNNFPNCTLMQGILITLSFKF